MCYDNSKSLNHPGNTFINMKVIDVARDRERRDGPLTLEGCIVFLLRFWPLEDEENRM